MLIADLTPTRHVTRGAVAAFAETWVYILSYIGRTTKLWMYISDVYLWDLSSGVVTIMLYARKRTLAMKGLYRSASLAALVVGSLWAVSQDAIADSVTITGQDFTGNAPLISVAAPVSSSGNFIESTSDSILGIQRSPYENNTDGNAGATYSVLGAGSPIGSATYNVGASSVSLLWGSPDSYNHVAFFSGPDGTGSDLGTFNGTDLACATGGCDQIGFDLVTFTDSSGQIGSVELSNNAGSAFEYRIDPPAQAPVPGAIYLFGSVLGGAFWLGRRRRSTVSGLDSV